jgi:hypothetical protein
MAFLVVDFYIITSLLLGIGTFFRKLSDSAIVETFEG